MYEKELKQKLFADLKSIEPIDFLSNKTNKEDASKFFAKLMTIFSNYEAMHLLQEEKEEFSNILLELGCPKIKMYQHIKQIRPTFFSEKFKDGFWPSVLKDGNALDAPLSIVGNLISNPDYSMGLSFGKNNWCDKWVNAFIEAHPDEKDIKKFITKQKHDTELIKIELELAELNKKEAEIAERKKSLQEQKNNIEQE